MSQALLSKQPSFMRYARVQGVLEQEDAFVAKMGSRTEAVFKPDGEKQLFSPEVIMVTQAIHSAGKDAHKVHKTEIVRIACQVFRIGRSDPLPVTNGAMVETPVPTPPPAPVVVPVATPVVVSPPEATKKQPTKPKAKQAAPPKPPEPPKPEEPKIKPPAPKPAPKAAATKAIAIAVPKPVPAPKPAPAPKPVPKAAAKPAAKAAPVAAPTAAETNTREAALAKAKELLNPERPTENPAAFNAYISIYSMILTALQLTEIYDNQPGKEKRYKTLDELAKEVNKFTAIKSAKEAQKA